jgi:hypothetical protein
MLLNPPAQSRKTLVAIWPTDLRQEIMIKIFITTLFIVLVTPMFSQTRTKADAMKFADTLYSRILEGTNISTLARIYSEDPGSAKDGGFIQFNPTKHQLNPNFNNQIMQLKAGETSKPFETEYGYHIAQLALKSDTLVQVRHILITFKR